MKIEPFADPDRTRAEEERLALELDLSQKNIDDEVVLLEAASEGGMRRTHRRYFEDLQQLISRIPSEDFESMHSR